MVLQWQQLRLRPLRARDGVAWRGVRERNAEWLRRWEATPPPQEFHTTRSFGALVRSLRRDARAGRQMPFAMEYAGRFIGQVSVSNIVRGSAQFASIGYWIDQAYAGRGLTPRAVAMVIDHCFEAAKLHRIEIAIRPENDASLRVVEKLGIPEIGFAPRYLHINGDWRDHRLFAICAEDVPEGLQARLEASLSE